MKNSGPDPVDAAVAVFCSSTDEVVTDHYLSFTAQVDEARPQELRDHGEAHDVHIDGLGSDEVVPLTLAVTIADTAPIGATLDGRAVPIELTVTGSRTRDAGPPSLLDATGAQLWLAPILLVVRSGRRPARPRARGARPPAHRRDPRLSRLPGSLRSAGEHSTPDRCPRPAGRRPRAPAGADRPRASRAVAVRRPAELDAVDGLVLPGGESTTMAKLARTFELLEPLRQRIADGLPAFGTCAGMILLADRIEDGVAGQETLGGLDVTVRRNAFGRQVDSFEEDLARRRARRAGARGLHPGAVGRGGRGRRRGARARRGGAGRR